jgi:hypothetical protein
MKSKKLLFIHLILITISLGGIAQTIPNYIPTNGLVGWWPFNGNANDESGNGNNGTINGATLTTDRFGISGKAFDFDGISNDIVVQNSNILNITGTEISISYWLYYQNPTTQYTFKGISKGGWDAQGGYELIFRGGPNNSSLEINGAAGGTYCESINQFSNQWINIIAVVNNGINKIYINGIEQTTLTTGNGLINLNASSLPLYFGRREPLNSYAGFLDGKLDDIGIWNRALTQQEITSLFNSQNCNLNASISTASASVNVGTNNQFTATTTDPAATIQWQTNPNNIGWQNVPNNTFYNGATTSCLTVNNVQLGNHNQPFRVIATSGNCIDTSNVAFIQIADTCVNSITVYDTISVTDTLFIDINTVGLNNNTIVNTIKVFPNPSNSILNLDYGNYASLNNYRVKITNSLSQIIYDQAITQQTETLDLSTFGGNGIYYLSIINPQGNVVEVRKIVLQ